MQSRSVYRSAGTRWNSWTGRYSHFRNTQCICRFPIRVRHGCVGRDMTWHNINSNCLLTENENMPRPWTTISRHLIMSSQFQWSRRYISLPTTNEPGRWHFFAVQYIQTTHIKWLMNYLEALHSRGLSTPDYTSLLLLCYAKSRQPDRAKGFLKVRTSISQRKKCNETPTHCISLLRKSWKIHWLTSTPLSVFVDKPISKTLHCI